MQVSILEFHLYASSTSLFVQLFYVVQSSHPIVIRQEKESSLLERLIKVANMERTGISAGRIITISYRDRLFSVHLDGALTQELCREADEADDVEDAWVYVVLCLCKGTAAR